MYGRDGRVGKELMFDACDFEVMFQVKLHILPGDALQMTFGDDSGSQGVGGAIKEQIHEVILSGQDDGKEGFGVGHELGNGVQFYKDIEPEKRCLIDDQEYLLLSGGGDFHNLSSDDSGKHGP